MVSSILEDFFTITYCLRKKNIGLTETRTRVTGFKVPCTNQLYYKTTD